MHSQEEDVLVSAVAKKRNAQEWTTRQIEGPPCFLKSQPPCLRLEFARREIRKIDISERG